MAPDMRDRERGFEAKFAHDEERRFIVHARRDKLFARWAASEMSLNEEQSDALVQAIVHIPDGLSHENALLEMIAHRLAGRSSVTPTDLPKILARCLAEAAAALDGPDQGQERGGTR